VTQSAAASRSGASILAQALGNVLLGIALGLVGYYLMTDLVTSSEQATLRGRFSEPKTAPKSEFDWSGWDRQDKAYWDSIASGEPFGRLVSERMGLDAVVVKGTSRSALMKGPGWMTWTDYPGPQGNCGIAGHRTTYGAPFRRIDKLRPGDIVSFVSPFRTYTYRVRKVFTVAPERGEVVRSTLAPMLTLSACHPLYSARLRIIASCELISVGKTGP
jgi:LPXTG-site transpeptidase (sortase) family protein